MPRIARAVCATDVYHIFIRGVGRQHIFEDDDDYLEFMALLENYSAKLNVAIFAYALMENHVHLLLGAPMKSISDFMRRLQTAYAHHFNVRHERAGYLFQGRFGSQGIADDDQFLAALSYIHMNPVRAGLSKGPDFKWSSYGEYFRSPHICDTSLAMNLLGNKDAFKALHDNSVDENFLDISDSSGCRRKAAESRAIEIAVETLGKDWRSVLLSGERAARDESIRRLKTRGLSIRQIERLTGIGRGIIQRA